MQSTGRTQEKNVKRQMSIFEYYQLPLMLTGSIVSTILILIGSAM